MDHVERTREAIRCWYEAWDGQVCVSYSGGIDSEVLGHITNTMYPDVPLVFDNTGLEYPDLVAHVKKHRNVVILRPKKSFKWVIENRGYPVVSKKVARFVRDLRKPFTDDNKNQTKLRLTGITSEGNYLPSMKLSSKWMRLIHAPFLISEECCDIIKKEPLKRYQKETGRVPMIGVRSEEGGQRAVQIHRSGLHGCNTYDAKHPISRPISFWTNQEILRYIVDNNISYAPVYGKILTGSGGELYTTGEKRTGCMFCCFGVHLENEPNRFQRMEKTHPTQYKFCMEKLGLRDVLKYIGVPFSARQLPIPWPQEKHTNKSPCTYHNNP